MINTKLLNLDEKTSKLVLDNFNNDMNCLDRHCAVVHFTNEAYSSPTSYLRFEDPLYTPPTTEEIKFIIELLANEFSKNKVSVMLGLNTSNDPTRTINRWIKGEATIPYCAWRMLLVMSGRVVEFMRVKDVNGNHLQKGE